MDDFNDLVKRLYWESLAKEGITENDVELVMLDVAFSPVIPYAGGTEKDAVEVHETVGGKYIVMAPTGPMTVSADILKVMRYRYLSNRPYKFKRS